MSGDDFVRLYHNRVLRAHIVETARRRSRRIEAQEDMIQEAWLVISTAPPTYETSFYTRLADKAIYSSYWQLNKDRLMQIHA